MKKLVSLLICFVLLFGMVSCKKKDDVKLPNDFSIINDVITFTEEEGYTYDDIFEMINKCDFSEYNLSDDEKNFFGFHGMEVTFMMSDGFR